MDPVAVDDWEQLYTSAFALDLVLKMRISSARDPKDTIWHEMDSFIKSMFARADLALPNLADEISNPQFGQLNWVLVKVTRKNSQLSMTRNTTLAAVDYTLNRLLKLAKEKTPEAFGREQVIIIGM